MSKLRWYESASWSAAILRRGVGRLRLQRMRLADRQRRGRAVDLARRGVHDRARPVPARRLEHVERAADVGVDERLGRAIRIRDGDQRREMEDDVDIAARVRDEARVADVAEADVERGA